MDSILYINGLIEKASDLLHEENVQGAAAGFRDVQKVTMPDGSVYMLMVRLELRNPDGTPIGAVPYLGDD